MPNIKDDQKFMFDLEIDLLQPHKYSYIYDFDSSFACYKSSWGF